MVKKIFRKMPPAAAVLCLAFALVLTGCDGTGGPANVGGGNGEPPSFVMISAGNQHTAAIAVDGSLWAWGNRVDGRLGDGITEGYQTTPIRIGEETDWVQVSAGTGHTLAVRVDGTLWGWGTGNNGRLGHGGIQPDGTVGSETGNRGGGPAWIGTETNWVYVSTVNQSTMGLRADGTLWGWGAGGQGRLGVGNANQQNAPAQVTYPAETGWVQLSMSTQHGLAIRDDGSLWAYRQFRLSCHPTIKPYLDA